LKTTIKKNLKNLKIAGNYRIRRKRDSGNSHIFVYKNKNYLSFASNDYLSLSDDKRIINSAKKSLDKYGFGTSSSPLISGYTKSHFKLEEEISKFLGQEKTLLFSTGYQANMGVIKSLVNRKDNIFADQLNHASLIDGSILSRANFKRYKHSDIKNLENLISNSKSLANNLIISDSLFSMDGDLANLKKLKTLSKKSNSLLLIDEAHALGVFGKSGEGLISEHGLNNEDNIFLTGTFGKSVGTYGAFFSGNSDYVEYVMQKARSYIYSTSIPVNAVEATRKSLKIIEKESWRREKLFSLIQYFKKNIKKINYECLDSDSQIQVIIIGKSIDAINVSEELLKKGIYLPAIRPPTVEEGKSRLRVSLTVNHEESDIDYLINILDTISRNLVQSKND
jgi:8-amino-7-oxononanoate synthase|tara:strand:- start:183 stop:1364 length:1182 start_codon:yes stop_codon:yes gene_type:complete